MEGIQVHAFGLYVTEAREAAQGDWKLKKGGIKKWEKQSA